MKHYLLFLYSFIFIFVSNSQIITNENNYYNIPVNDEQKSSGAVKNSSLFSNETKVTVTPNPIKMSATISLSENTSPLVLIIYNVLGKEIKRIKTNTNNVIFERGNHYSGIYILKVTTEDGIAIHTQKLIFE